MVHPHRFAHSIAATARSFAAAAPAFAAAALLAATPAAGQTVIGQVLDDATAAPLAVTTVMLLDSTDTAVSVSEADSAGWFALQAPMNGRYRLFADRLGYGEVVSDTLDVAAGRSTAVEIRMTPKPVELDAVVVSAERRRLKLAEKGFYQRRDNAMGYFIDAERIVEEKPSRATDLLRNIPGLRLMWSDELHADVVGARRGFGWSGAFCPMRIVLDGWPLEGSEALGIDHFVSPAEIIGVEVYPNAGGAGAPVRYRGPESYCGIIMIWTR